MIISASRRTDIPSYYSDWFYNRIKEGFVFTRNPMNFHQISKINLTPDVVDGIVFWTKNPLPILGRLSELEDYMYYFQFTITPYGKDVEPNLPSKNDVILSTFKKLSDTIGVDRVIWRYDPIFISEKYPIEYARCIDDRLLGRLLECNLNVDKDKNQRLECGCITSVDIGMYNTCRNGCRYCYANYSGSAVDGNYEKHNPYSPLISGEVVEGDKIKERDIKSCRDTQMKL